MTPSLTNKVLVLNSAWTLIDVTTVWHALVKVCGERAKIVDRDYSLYGIDEWIVTWDDAARCVREAESRNFVGIVGGKIATPEVIKQDHYRGYHQCRLKLSRRAIFERDEYTCQYCGRRYRTSELSLDHIVPRSRGGRDSWTNLVLACTGCNARKHAHTPREAGMKLIRQPREPRSAKPSWYSRLRSCTHRPQFWRKFLDNMYWEIPLSDQ